MGDIVGPPAADPKASWAGRRLTVLYETAHALASSASLAEGVPRTLAAVCQAFGWDYGALWNVDRSANVLRCVATWSLPTLSFETFVEASGNSTFSPGDRLAGPSVGERQARMDSGRAAGRATFRGRKWLPAMACTPRSASRW